jgi:outer membrane immunogenic protein
MLLWRSVVKRYVSLSGVSFAFAAALLGSANAADMSMPVKAPAYSPPPSNWSGFYIGINGGAGWGTAASSIDLGALAAGLGAGGVTGTIPVGSHEINGFLGGGQIGYNWQSGNIVFGVEGDGDWADIEGTAPCIEVLSCSAKINWTADATARLGVLPMSNVLVYVKGGVAWAGLDYNLSSSGLLGAGTSLGASLSTTKTGGLLGIGTEYLFAPHWTAKIEYNYTDFGSHTDSFTLSETGVGSIAVPVSTTLQLHTVKAGINYHF